MQGEKNFAANEWSLRTIVMHCRWVRDSMSALALRVDPLGGGDTAVHGGHAKRARIGRRAATRADLRAPPRLYASVAASHLHAVKRLKVSILRDGLVVQQFGEVVLEQHAAVLDEVRLGVIPEQLRLPLRRGRQRCERRLVVSEVAADGGVELEELTETLKYRPSEGEERRRQREGDE
jgi:hypothetical protein